MVGNFDVPHLVSFKIKNIFKQQKKRWNIKINVKKLNLKQFFFKKNWDSQTYSINLELK